MLEAQVAMCKCKANGKTYGVRFQKYGDLWKYTWAFPMSEEAAEGEGYVATSMKGNIEPSEGYPGCPYCGVKRFIVCGCGKLNCHTGVTGEFTCGWCGMTGTLTAYTGDGITGGGY